VGTRVAPEATLRQEVGTGATGTRDTPGAALSREVGAGATGTHGAPGAALSREVGTGTSGTCGAPRAAMCWGIGVGALGTRGAPGAASPPFPRPFVRGQDVVVPVTPLDNPHQMITRARLASGWCLIIFSSLLRPLHRHHPRSPPSLVLRLSILIDVRLWRKSMAP
jgi:hypothetical protein